MKNRILSAVAAVLLISSLSHAATEGKTSDPRSYGTITVLDQVNKNLTVLNKKKQQETQFSWNGQTQFVKDKNPTVPTALEVGQYLYIAYADEGSSKIAKKITIRPAPFKKKASAQ